LPVAAGINEKRRRLTHGIGELGDDVVYPRSIPCTRMTRETRRFLRWP
jgi:hypothetical protein